MPVDRPIDASLLLDIDGTLVDNRYQLTDQAIFSTIRGLTEDSGWTVGLSSDSALELMASLAGRLGMNGPLIAEKGAVVSINGVEYIDETVRQKFSDIYSESLAALKIALPTASFWFGDPAEAIRLGIPIGDSGETVVLVNAGRKCSFGIFVRRIVDGEPKIVNDLTDLAYGSIMDRCTDTLLDKDLNHEYGLLILSQPAMTKRIGSMVMMDALGLEQIGMIGNSMTDFIGADIAKHYAVANASEQLIKVADYTSKFNLTTGVIDILRSVSTNSD